MDTECKIKWIDDGNGWYVTIRSAEWNEDEDDDEIFFYGMSRDECIKAMENKTICEGEWRIVEVC